MLISVSANKDEFTRITFQRGFNAIVAERDKESTDQQSRNARGKSSLLLLINYVLAGNLHKSLQPLAADGWEITLELEMFGGTISATRSLSSGSHLNIRASGPATEAVSPYLAQGKIALADWKELLGISLFRLEPEAQQITGGISARTLLSYAIRTDTPKDPLKIISQQSATSSRQHVAFLLGLDWEIIHELAGIQKSLTQLKVISAASTEGLVSTLRPEGDLIMERVGLLNEREEWQSRVTDFRILEDPNELVARADELTARISRLRDVAVVDKRMRDLYVASLVDPDDRPLSTPSVEQLFEVAGAVLAEGFKRHIRDVQEFHSALIHNRRAFLRSEIETLERRLAETGSQLSELDERRHDALRVLEAGGALDELKAMHDEIGSIEGRLAALDLQIEQARELITRREGLKLEQSTRKSDALQALAGSRERLDQIGDRFSQKMRRLYGKDATLAVTVDNAGYKFQIRATGEGSAGVDRMTLFCFDLTMLEEGIRTSHHPDFLIHDSSVFDGVDPRQRAKALRFAQEMVEETGGQYICTINSNDIPDEVLAEDWFRFGVIRTVLDTEHGGLIGREF